MLYWLAAAAREAREEQDLLQVEIAATLRRNQSTIARFEKAEGWPKNVEETIAAYTEDLGVDPRDLWAKALQLWRNSAANGRDREGHR